jgi:antitoxin (DNA-binding transcriptional repressor) of toxin-antitoxin stability system
MSHVKEITIRELHRRTGAWVRSAGKYGSILVRDRRRPVARITPTSDEPEINRFAAWTPERRFAAALVGSQKDRTLVSQNLSPCVPPGLTAL